MSVVGELRGLAEAAGRGELGPHRGARIFDDYAADLVLECDVAVVGSGPGGAVVAKELAELGRDVILLEEGPPLGARDFRLDAGEALNRMMREGGMRTTRGGVYMPTMQAIALGGGSVVNSAICARSPAWVFEKWADQVGTTALTGDTVRPHYERVERFMGVAATPMRVQGERNLRFKRGCDALGISSEPTHRNARGCEGSGECFTGCRNGAKQSTDVSYVPAAIRAGARVLTSVRVERVMSAHGRGGLRATGVEGRAVAPFTGRSGVAIRVHARIVVLAAGCMATPVLLDKSGLSGRSGYCGRELQLHPGLAVMALFTDPIEPWAGATQGYHSLHFLREGLKLEVLWSPPAILSARLPGLGYALQEQLSNLRRMAPFDVIVAAERSKGSVRARRCGLDPDIRFELDPRDVASLQRGLCILSEVCWAAGAEAILPGIHGVADRLTSRAEAEILRTRCLEGSDAVLVANHAFGTTRMARSANAGVVDEDGACHDVAGLYIADTGIFPASPAVNPMLTCMALADRIAGRIHLRE